ncbi:MAG: hypothetical protein A2281_12860 [Bacteroidetes bacterium RIFOXYA12_FULL_38_20]|nr:MAG: hypothetical protein A2281_12860 [Bacteroidetes bacterium RIFOXYA12_FULL_38_20]
MERKIIFAVFFALAGFLLVTCKTEKNTAAVSTVLSPAFEGVDVKFSPFNLDANKGGVIHLDNGGSIVVPPDAFVDASGESVTGTVKIDFREFHNAYDIILAGIPMSYDSAGVKYDFETAGMFDIRGYAGNSEIFIREGSKISVNLASFNQGEDFGFYALDEKSGDWQYITTGRSEINVTKKRVLDSLSALGDKPVKPLKYEKGGTYLDFKVFYNQFPELKELGSVIWKYTGTVDREDPSKNKWIYREKWASMDLIPYNSEAGQYKLKLTSNQKAFETTISAVLIGDDFNAAMEIFQEQMGMYREKFTERVQKEEMANLQADILRSYDISSFGIYNWDRYMKQPSVIAVKADFKFDAEIPDKNDIIIYLISDNEKSLVKYAYSDWDKFAFKPDNTNKLVAVIPGNKIAVFTIRDFENINTDEIKAQKSPVYTFNMKTIERKIEKPEDFLIIMKSV